MAVLPGEVGDEKPRVEDEANCVVNPLVITEGMVATLVGNNPNASADAALDDPVEGPGQVGERVGE